jgi:hypothetical protein
MSISKIVTSKRSRCHRPPHTRITNRKGFCNKWSTDKRLPNISSVRGSSGDIIFRDMQDWKAQKMKALQPKVRGISPAHAKNKECKRANSSQKSSPLQLTKAKPMLSKTKTMCKMQDRSKNDISGTKVAKPLTQEDCLTIPFQCDKGKRSGLSDVQGDKGL